MAKQVSLEELTKQFVFNLTFYVTLFIGLEIMTSVHVRTIGLYRFIVSEIINLSRRQMG